VFFNRLFLLAFFAIVALAPGSVLSAVEVPVLNATVVPVQSEAEGTAAHAENTVAMNNLPENNLTETPPVKPDLKTVADPSIPATTPAINDPAQASLPSSPTLTTDTTLTQNDLWQRIRNGYAMPDLDSPLIARHEQWYADRPDYVARMTERAQRYLYFITEEVEKRGMPTEIALLPMIESAFNPGAYSVSSASGIWQFIPSTGKNFGLQQNWWYDGRRDIVSATKGALDYLQKLHDQFGDWELALAAYNWGEGAVERAQEHNRKRGLPVDYASLKMPDETRNYVPKLLAVKNIIGNPDSFGLALQPIPNQPYFTAVTTARHIDVKLAAKLADISLDEFNALNPAHTRPVILQENADVLLLPIDKAETFRANLESYSEPLVSWQAYQSKKGERLDKVAPRFGLSLAKLKSINGLSPRAKLSNGQALLVPLNGEDADNEFEAFNTHLVSSDRPTGRFITYTVRRGETLSSVARRYHVSVAKLQNWNSDLSQLKPGQRITIVQSGKPKHIAKAGKPRRLAKAGKTHTRLASATRSKKQYARQAQLRVRVAYNR
jgi:membrane-bound lytic murein transglycosylase D